jgi:hypothetical protein
MVVSLSDLTAVITMLTACPDVPVAAIDFTHSEIAANGTSTDIIDLRIHAISRSAARTLANTLTLDEDTAARQVSEPTLPGARPLLWRSWAGWAPNSTHDIPIRIEIVTCDPTTTDARQ